MNSFKYMELYVGKGGSLRVLKGSREYLYKFYMSVGELLFVLVYYKLFINVLKGKFVGKFIEIRGLI